MQRAVKADPNNGETWATLAYTYLLRSQTLLALPARDTTPPPLLDFAGLENMFELYAIESGGAAAGRSFLARPGHSAQRAQRGRSALEAARSDAREGAVWRCAARG